MSAKNTPGPWVVRTWVREHRTASGENQPRFKFEVSTTDGSPIESSTSNEANARLIASAPIMLVALEAVKNLLTRETRYGAEELTILLHTVRVAIREAKGGE